MTRGREMLVLYSVNRTNLELHFLYSPMLELAKRCLCKIGQVGVKQQPLFPVGSWVRWEADTDVLVGLICSRPPVLPAALSPSPPVRWPTAIPSSLSGAEATAFPALELSSASHPYSWLDCLSDFPASSGFPSHDYFWRAGSSLSAVWTLLPHLSLSQIIRLDFLIFSHHCISSMSL